MPIQHTVTRSSMISEVDYDSDEKLLTLTFSKGGKYQYEDVSKDVYEGLLNAESIGKYFLAHIKNKYVTEKI
jgi:hypothetical protein